jgi:membrane fusion protein (multidrug efflux system)
MIKQFKDFFEKVKKKFRSFSESLLNPFSKQRLPRTETKIRRLSSEALHSLIFFQLMIIIAGIGGAGWYYWKVIKEQNTDKKVEFPKAVVEAGPVDVGVFETFLTTVGTLKANESIVIRPEIEGKIKSVLFKSGEKVSKGDTLIILEDDTYVARQKEARSKVSLWKGKYERANTLYERKAGTLKEKDESYHQLKIAEAELELARSQKQKTVIKAPFEGYIGFKDISPGSYVKPGEDLVVLDDFDPVKVDFRLAETLLDKISIGKEVQVEVEGFQDSVYPATIEAIDSNVDPLGHNIRVRATLSNKEDLFKPGLFVKVKLLLSSHENVIMVPETALESRGNQEFVYVVDQGLARYTPVRPGGRNGEKVEILSGLQPGQIVIVAGQMKVQDRFPVMVVPPQTLKRG